MDNLITTPYEQLKRHLFLNTEIDAFFNILLKLRTSKKPVDHEKSIDNATKVTKLSSH